MGGDVHEETVIEANKTVSFDESEQLAAVEFEIRNERSVPVAARLLDSIPDEVDPSALGFRKPDREHWSIVNDETLEYSGYVPADGEVNARYAVRDATDVVERLRGPPRVVDAQPVSPDEFDGRHDVPVWRGGGGTAVDPGGEDVPTDDVDEAASTGDLAGAAEASGAEPLDVEAAVERLGEDDAGSTADAHPGSEPASTEPPAGGRPSVPTSVDVRLKRIETELSELAAYKDAMEEFLDQQGSGRSIREALREQRSSIAAVRSTVTATEARVEGVETACQQRTDALDGEVASLRDRLDDLSGMADRIDGMAERLDDLTGDVESLSDRVGTVAASVDDVEAAVAGTDDDLADLRKDVTDVESALERTAGEVEDVEATVAGLAERLDAVTGRVDGAGDRLADLESAVDDVDGLATDLRSTREAIDELESTQDRILAVFETVATAGPREAVDGEDPSPSTDRAE